MADEEQFSLCWNNFNSNLSAGFHESLCRGDLVDVTLAAEGQLVKAHRLVLSVCSPYFRKMFTQMPANQHAFVFLKDVSHAALKDLIQFMYCGEVNVKQDALPSFISTAEALQIKGLTETGEQSATTPASQSPVKIPTPAPSITSTSPRSRAHRNVSRTSYKHESEDSSDDKPIVAQKRVLQRSVTPQTAPVLKRVKNNDPLEASEPTAQLLASTSDSKSMDEPEFIDLPVEGMPTKSEPEYGEDAGEVEAVDQDQEETSYVEDDSYGDMKYDDSYFTENEDKAGASGFTESYTETGDQSANEAQGGEAANMFIISRKGGIHLVHQNFVYRSNMKRQGREMDKIYWECIYNRSIKCRGRLKSIGDQLFVTNVHHNHVQDLKRVEAARKSGSLIFKLISTIGPKQITKIRLLDSPIDPTLSAVPFSDSEHLKSPLIS